MEQKELEVNERRSWMTLEKGENSGNRQKELKFYRIENWQHIVFISLSIVYQKNVENREHVYVKNFMKHNILKVPFSP